MGMATISKAMRLKNNTFTILFVSMVNGDLCKIPQSSTPYYPEYVSRVFLPNLGTIVTFRIFIIRSVALFLQHFEEGDQNINN